MHARHALPWPWPWALPVGTAAANFTVAAVCARSTALSVLSICTQEDLQTVFAMLKYFLKCCSQALFTLQTVSALHCSANSVCNQHLKQCFSIANTVCKHSQFQSRHFGKCKAAKAIAQQCKAAQTCKHCDAVKGHLQQAKLRALHHSASLL